LADHTPSGNKEAEEVEEAKEAREVEEEGSRKIRRERKALRALAFMSRLSLKKRIDKLRYMHMNPLKRKLADHPMDWPWSSFSFYAKIKSGLIRVDPVK
jgi:putative transposase